MRENLRAQAVPATGSDEFDFVTSGLERV